MQPESVPLGLTFDDVLPVPQRSPLETHAEVDTHTVLARAVELCIPIGSRPSCTPCWNSWATGSSAAPRRRRTWAWGNPVPVEVLEHTAEVGLRAHADTLPGVLEELAAGLFGLITNPSTVREAWPVEVNTQDFTALAVEWLNELLFLHARDGTLARRCTRRGRVGCGPQCVARAV